MSTSHKSPPKDPKEQSRAFIDKAKEVEADESGEVFERAFEKIVPPKKSEPDERS